MASPVKQDAEKETSLKTRKHSKPRKQSLKPGSSGSNLLESYFSRSKKVGAKKFIAENDLHENAISQSKLADMVNGSTKVANKSTCSRKKAPRKLSGTYRLRSLNSSRVLRSKSNTPKCEATMNPTTKSKILVTRKKKGGKKFVKKSDEDELSRVKKQIRYMLNRMNYEQSLIDAYSGDGWKGQSAEKIRPEKELDRAKSEILRCKLKIREMFKHLDSLLAEGRIQESLFDPDGIDSEHIFCGKCGSKEASVDNDIILCDGICDRGFHQQCLNPPLRSEEIPTGDEGWLCPQCDCKVECIDLLNEFRGTDLSIEDSWERFFPEAAVLANGNGHYENPDLPSDDSEDDDYDPDARGIDVDDDHEEELSYKESNSSSSDDSISSDDNMKQAAAELSTDDSEDDDYDPDAPDLDKEIKKLKSSSDESDFTSDSDDFCDELKQISCAKEASALSVPSLENFVDSNRDDMKADYDCSEIPSSKLDIDEESGLGSSQKRDRERLDYKKLYDEAYGKSSSDSSDDEEWNETNTPKKLKKTDDEEIEVGDDSIVKKAPKLHKNDAFFASEKDRSPQEPHSSGSNSATVRKKFGVSSKSLQDAFRESQYPTKERKESLAQELGLTIRQVTKWFENMRHSFRVSAKESSNSGIRCDTPGHSEPDEGAAAKSPASSIAHRDIDKIETTKHRKLANKKLDEFFQKSPCPSKEKEKLDQELALVVPKDLNKSDLLSMPNGAASIVMGKKASKSESVDRQKAVAKELKKMKTGR